MDEREKYANLLRDMAAKYERMSAELHAFDPTPMDAEQAASIEREIERREGELNSQLVQIDKFITWARSQNLLRTLEHE
jgi:hypothetical protein